MSIGSDFKLLKEKKLGKDASLTVSKSIMSGRIFVEYKSTNPKLILQKNFQDTVHGRKEADSFAKFIRSENQLKEYFGIKKEK